MPPEPDSAVPPPSTEADVTAGPAPRSRLEAVERRLTELTRDHRQAVRELSTLLEEHRATRRVGQESTDLLAEALPRLDATTDALIELQGRVDALSTQLAATPRIAAVSWPALTATEAHDVWEALATWVTDVLGPFYRITRGELPDCWARHPDAVLELVWLHTSYREAFENGTGRPAAAAEWHTRWRSEALKAIAAAIPARLCRPGEHLVSERDADAARSDARDARARAAASPTARDDTGARSAEGYRPPPRSTTEPDDPGARPTHDPRRDQVISREHWVEHFEQGRADDLDWRRRREQ